ncbi:MAG: hypothetical protein V4527_12090 [Pseudomonadota bacterium]
MKTGLFGGDWEDFIQPVNDYFDNAIAAIQSGGAHAAIARMQAEDDALGANAGNGAENAEPGLAAFSGGEGQQYGTDLPTGNPGWPSQDLSDSSQALQYSPGDSRVRDVSFRLGGDGSGSTGGSRDIPPLGQPGPQSAAGLYPILPSQPVHLQGVPAPDTSRPVAKGSVPAYDITLDTVLPDGSTVGSRVKALADDINSRGQTIDTPYGPVMQFGDRSDPVSVVTDVYNGTNFKKMFAGPNVDPELLGQAGNFAYGAVAARLGIPLGAAEVPAGLYSLINHPAKDWGWPYGMDRSARLQMPKGYGAK